MAYLTQMIKGEIDADFVEIIINEMSLLQAIHSPVHSILIHGMGGKERSFYWKLRRKNKSVELLWTGWSSNVWWTYLLSFLAGQAGLAKVLDISQIAELYLSIGGQSMCGLYFIPCGKVAKVLENIKSTREPNLLEILSDERNYFLLVVDFDYYSKDRDGEIVYREVIMGETLDPEIVTLLTRTK